MRRKLRLSIFVRCRVKAFPGSLIGAPLSSLLPFLPFFSFPPSLHTQMPAYVMARALFVQPEIHDPAELNFKWVVRIEEGKEGAEDRREVRAAAGVKGKKEGKRNPLQLCEKLMVEHAAPYIPI